MLIRIPAVLTAAEVAHCRQVLESSAWVDGRATAGAQAPEQVAAKQRDVSPGGARCAVGGVGEHGHGVRG